eukprot:IDg21492t1
MRGGAGERMRWRSGTESQLRGCAYAWVYRCMDIRAHRRANKLPRRCTGVLIASAQTHRCAAAPH